MVAVWLSGYLCLSDGYHERALRAHPCLFKDAAVLLHRTFLHGVFPVSLAARSHCPALCRHCLSHSVPDLSRHGFGWNNLLRLPLHRTGEYGKRSYLVLPAFIVAAVVVVPTNVVVAHVLRFSVGRADSLLVCRMLAHLSRGLYAIGGALRSLGRFSGFLRFLSAERRTAGDFHLDSCLFRHRSHPFLAHQLSG